MATKKEGSKCVLCVVVAADSISRMQVKSILQGIRADHLVHRPEDQGIKAYASYYYLCSLRNFPVSRLRSACPNARASSNPHLFAWSDVTRPGALPSCVTVCVLSHLNSVPDIRREVRQALGCHSDKKGDRQGTWVSGEYHNYIEFHRRSQAHNKRRRHTAR